MFKMQLNAGASQPEAISEQAMLQLQYDLQYWIDWQAQSPVVSIKTAWRRLHRAKSMTFLIREKSDCV